MTFVFNSQKVSNYPLAHACHFNIAALVTCIYIYEPAAALKSLYISHLISPTRLLLSVKQLKPVEDKVSYSAMVLCDVVVLCSS